MKRLCTIGARGGSIGVKNKNIRDLLGKPLIAHTIQRAKEAALFEAVSVSSDSDVILDIAGQWGADHLIKRPAELATDEAPKVPAIRHCLLETELRTGITYDVIVDLDATNPLRTVEDIKGAVALLEEKKVFNVISGTPARKSPYFNLVEMDARGAVHLSKPLPSFVVRRQDSPVCYDLNAAIYVWWRDTLLKSEMVYSHDTHLFVMPAERSIDIDTELDFAMAEFLARKMPEFQKDAHAGSI